jgi:hypothetical protein
MEAAMTDSFQLTMAALAALTLGALVPAPAFAIGDGHPSPLSGLMGHDATPEPMRTQTADSVQSTGDSSGSSSSASASASASSSATATGGQKQGKCQAEATAKAQANGIEDSDHDLKVVEGDDCSAKAESRATVKPRKQQSE